MTTDIVQTPQCTAIAVYCFIQVLPVVLLKYCAQRQNNGSFFCLSSCGYTRSCFARCNAILCFSRNTSTKRINSQPTGNTRPLYDRNRTCRSCYTTIITPMTACIPILVLLLFLLVAVRCVLQSVLCLLLLS